jgi:hypothetical protein
LARKAHLPPKHSSNPRKQQKRNSGLYDKLAKLDITMEKRFTKVVKNPKTGRTKTVKYGQAGKAKDGGDRIRPGTAKGDAYCARSAKIKGDWKSDPNSPNNLSRKKWRCRGSKSMK